MSTFKKKDFENINELVNADGGAIEGDRNVTNNSEIETGPVQAPFNDDSGYEKGMSTTTDRASRYRQPTNWLNGVGFGGSAYSHGIRGYNSVTENKDIKELVKEFLRNKSNDNDVINNNDIPDLEKLNNLATISKTKEFLNVIQNNNLNGEQVAIMLNFILTNLNTKTIPNNYRNILIKKINA